MANREEFACPLVCFDPETDDYISWRRKADIWLQTTEMKKTKLGPTLFFKLKGRAMNVIENMDTSIMASNTGYKKVLEKLDEIFLPSEYDREFFPLRDLFEFTRKEKMENYLIDYEQRLNKSQNMEGTTISDKVAAYKLLMGAGLSESQNDTVKAALGSDSSYENMKRVLKKLYGGKKDMESQRNIDNDNNSGSGSGTFYGASTSRSEEKKSDEVFFSGAKRGSYRGSSRGRPIRRSGFSPRKFSRPDDYRSNKSDDSKRSFSRDDYRRSFSRMNPVGRYGETLACNFCRSIFHLRKECPELDKSINTTIEKNSDDKRKPNYSWFSSVYMTDTSPPTEDKLQELVEECDGYAILDSGCPNTVCGEKWMRRYIQNLSPLHQEALKYVASNESFTFGDGKRCRSTRKMTFPIWTTGEEGELTSDVVEANIPLLFSIKGMEKAEMRVDLKRAEVILKGEKIIKLKKTSSGHYAIPLGL